eukprot:1155594-Pelagomonas_calceolata.AAC.5
MVNEVNIKCSKALGSSGGLNFPVRLNLYARGGGPHINSPVREIHLPGNSLSQSAEEFPGPPSGNNFLFPGPPNQFSGPSGNAVTEKGEKGRKKVEQKIDAFQSTFPFKSYCHAKCHLVIRCRKKVCTNNCAALGMAKEAEALTSAIPGFQLSKLTKKLTLLNPSNFLEAEVLSPRAGQGAVLPSSIKPQY